MTRPIYEPTPARTDAKLGFGNNQLFRRPAPRSAAGGELPYALMEWTNGGDVPNDSKTAIEDIDGGAPWDNGYINAAGLAMTPQPFAFDFTEGKITFRSSGLYHAELMVQWADTFPNPGYVYTILDYFGNCLLSSNCGDWISVDPIFNTQDIQQNWFYATGLWVSLADDDNDSYVHGFVGQITGTGDKFLSGASLAITRLSEYSGDGEFFP